MSRTLTYTVPPAWDGRTVKDFARQHLGLSSRAFVKQKYLPGGLVKNGQPCRSVDLLRAGDRLCLTLPEEAETYQAVEGPPLHPLRGPGLPDRGQASRHAGAPLAGPR